MKNKLWLICLAISLSVYSQDKLSYIENTSFFEKIDSLSSLEKYQEIIDVLDMVNENDSIIHLANIKKSYYLLELKEYDKAITVCNKALKNAKLDSDITSLYINKAIAYSKSDKFDEAIQVFDDAIKKFPKKSEFYRRRGGLYNDKGQSEKAYEDLKKAIIINPFEVNNHLILGDLFLLENKLAQALMIYNMYLLISPDGDNSYNVLNFFNNKFASRIDNTPKGITFTIDDEKLEEVNLFIENRIALNKDYKVKNKIKIAYAKQNHLLFSLINDIEFEDEFFKKYYSSIYNWMIDQNKLDDFIYTTCYSIKNEKYKKIINKKEKNVIEFYSLFKQEYLNRVEEVEEVFDGEIKKVYHSYEDLELVGIGLKKDNKYNGLWEFYNSSGKLRAKGAFDENEERIGEWNWYHSNGQVKEKLSYIKGKAEGDYRVYYPNGSIKIESYYKEDVLNGNYKLYNKRGALTQNKNFVNDELNGSYKSFYSVGKDLVEYDVNYKNDKLEGEFKQFYPNQNLYYTVNYINDLKEGDAKYFFRNNKPLKTFSYVNSSIEGEFVEYYKNGNIYQKGNYINDELDGLWDLNFSNGKKHKSINYKSGEYNGLYREYSELGHMFQEYDYKKDKLYRAKFFDKNKNVLYDQKKEHNELDFKGYGTLGNIRNEGLYNVKGGSKGTWKFYDRNGNKTSEEFYVENQLEGELITYYNDGVIKSKSNYSADQLNGYEVYYYHSGQISSQGYYLEGNDDKEYRSYYRDGTLKNKLYYHKGDLNGKQFYYKVDGTISYTEVYDYGELIKHIEYGKTGADIVLEIDYLNCGKNGAEQITKKYSNGNINNKITYLNGIAHGEAFYYYPTGELNTKGNYHNDSKQGKWEWYYKNGKLKLEASFDRGDLHGERIAYYENGNISAKSTYSLGSIVGQSIYYAKDGKSKTQTIEYTNGVKNGASFFYDDKENIQLVRYYNLDILIGYSHLDTQGKMLEMIPVDNETAKIIAYYKNGKISREFEVIGGTFENSYKTYHYNGQLQKENVYINDLEQGVRKEYYETGQVKEISNYLEGNLHGKYQEFYLNGNLKEEYLYKNDEKNGPYIKFNKNGEIIEQGVCSDGIEYKS